MTLLAQSIKQLDEQNKRKKIIIPDKMKNEIETPKEPDSSTASGIRCKKAPPNNVPAEILTKVGSKWSIFFFPKNKVTIPIKDTNETTMTLMIV